MIIHEADVVVIGGGLAGALIACSLAPKHRVLVIEAGSPIASRLEAVGAYAASHTKSLTSPYRDPKNDDFASFPDGSGEYLGDKRFKSTYVRRAGGTTWHWQGSTPRLLPSDFRMRSTYGVGVDWPISYQDLEKWYAQAEVELGVSGDRDEWDHFHGAWRSSEFPMPPIWASYSDRRFTERLGDMEIEGQPVRVRRTPQARNSEPYQDRPACAGNSTCIPICPIGAKYDATVHLARARSRHVTILERTVAARVRLTSDGVEAVELRRWQDDGTVTSEEARSTKRIYVIAAHAVESARLLLFSGIRDESDQLGRNLMDHPTGQVVGMAPEPWYPFRGPPVTSGIDDLREGGFRATRAAWKLSLGNDGYGRFRSPEATVKRWLASGVVGADLRKRIEEDVPRMFRISWGSEQLPSPANRVELSDQLDPLGLPRAKLTYDVDGYTRGTFAHIRAAILALFERVGVRDAELAPDPAAYGGSGHIMGTCRMGNDPATSVADAYGRVHAHPALFIAGSALLPTVGTANPSLTVAALALRTAEHIDRTI